jgi:hypothetical protein
MRIQLSNNVHINANRIKSPSGNGPYCFQIQGQFYHLVSLLYPDEANKPGSGQLCTFDSAVATTKQ